MTKHTPGPFRKQGHAILNANGEILAMLKSSVHGPIFPREAHTAGELFAAAPETAAQRDRLREINADLLAALKWIADQYTPKDDALINQTARAAIAKAEGSDR